MIVMTSEFAICAPGLGVVRGGDLRAADLSSGGAV